ncbi:MAG: sulfatase/phosphatase domain-containing protein, partial [Planctomycetota bacterium]|nr:sulfatase/phosphatase domain-containing protein [Planctomycetota bacterium]
FPGVIKPGTEIDRITANLDLVPTLLQLCDVPTPAAIDGDGRDLTPLLTGQVAAADWADRSLMVFQGRGEKGAIRTQKWRAVQGKPGVWTLYDMEVDPSETSNVAKQHPEVLKRLRGEYEAFLKEVDAGNMQPLPIQIGHDEWPTVKLPAHEAELTPTPPDGLSYVGRSGWANDWLTNWSSPVAFASWPIQVVEPGNYAVTVEYSLKSATPPVKIELQAGDHKLTAGLSVAYEAAQIPSPDRITRKEVYERTWKTLKIGSLRLEDDATLLKIRALNANNNPNLEIKSIALTRLTGRSSE